MPAFYDGQQDYIQKLNELYAYFMAGPFNAVPLAGGVVMTGPLTIPTLTLTNALAITSGGTGAGTAANARTNLGLGNVDNTSDASKPVSTAQQAALDAKPSINNLGLRNQIINGGMRVDQRNSGSVQTINTASTQYTCDRFFAKATGANVTGQRVLNSGVSPPRYNYQITGAAGVSAVLFGQRIEAFNASSLCGGSAALSVDLANSTLTSVTWTAYYANSPDAFLTKTQFASGTFTVGPTLSRYSAAMTVPAAAAAGIEIELRVGAQVSGVWGIGDVQLESGAVSTAFEQRPIALEATMCQRYCAVLMPDGAPDIAMAAFVYSTSTAYGTYSFGNSSMRAPPTITIGAGGAAASFALMGGGGGNIPCTNLVFSAMHRKGFSFAATIGTTFTLGSSTVLRFSTLPTLVLDSEL